MAKVVNGFSPIISKYNLATNGSFTINQRGTGDGVIRPVKANDFVSDAWFVHSNTNVDFLQAQNVSINYSNLALQGRGKKGQMIQINSRDNSNPTYANGVSGLSVITASVNCGYGGGVPVQVFPFPRYTNNSHTTLLQRGFTASSSRGTGFATQIDQFQAISPNMAAGGILIYLLGTGDFNITLNNYMELSGAYANPPEQAPVHPSEDLLRCKRYYQKGTAQLGALGYSDGTVYGLKMNVLFPVEMAGTPTLAMSNPFVFEEGSGTNVQANYNTTVFQPSSYQAFFVAYKGISGVKPSFAQIDWVATV